MRSAREEDAKIRDFIRSGGYARVCGCSQLSVGQWSLRLPDDCHLDTLPASTRKVITDPDPAGRLVKESPTPLIVGLRLSSTYAGGVEISTSLPGGHGGSLGTEGGDPDKEISPSRPFERRAGPLSRGTSSAHPLR